jgi:hypothetical protein
MHLANVSTLCKLFASSVFPILVLIHLFYISSCVYFQNPDIRRAIMIKHHEPGPYIDVAGPTVLTIIIVMTIIVQFVGKLHSVMNSE